MDIWCIWCGDVKSTLCHGTDNNVVTGLASAHQWTCVCQRDRQLTTFLSSTSRKVLCSRKLKTRCTKVQRWRKETTCCVSLRETCSASPRGICFDCQSEQKRRETKPQTLLIFSFGIFRGAFLLSLMIFYQDSNRDLRLSKRPEWSEVDWQTPLLPGVLDKKDKSEVRSDQT